MERARRNHPVLGALVLALLSAVWGRPEIAAPASAPRSDAPTPCVGVLYSSWPGGAYRYRDANEALFRKLGWAVLRFENTHVDEFIAALDQCDLVIPGDLYNYEHRHDLAKFAPAWRRFLGRGGVVLAADDLRGEP